MSLENRVDDLTRRVKELERRANAKDLRDAEERQRVDAELAKRSKTLDALVADDAQ